MNILNVLLAPITTYLELTVSEPCQTIRAVRRSRKVLAKKDPAKRFSLIALLRRQKSLASPNEEVATPLMHVASVTEHYYRHYHDAHELH